MAFRGFRARVTQPTRRRPHQKQLHGGKFDQDSPCGCFRGHTPGLAKPVAAQRRADQRILGTEAQVAGVTDNKGRAGPPDATRRPGSAS